ncbi:hypothetical protein THRCLA_01217, partial [Thraustotheca clavata]
TTKCAQRTPTLRRIQNGLIHFKMGITKSTPDQWHGQCQRIAIFGLSGAGKTTLLNRWIYNVYTPAVPTIGCSFEQFQYQNTFFMVWDVSGDSISSWGLFTDAVDAIVFVIDASTALSRLNEIQSAFHTLCNSIDTNTKCVVILNKQDLENTMSCHQLAMYLSWQVFSCSAMDGTVKAACTRRVRNLFDCITWRDTPRKIYMVGLANAGKTSILYQYKFNEATTTVPTIGFNVETFNYKKMSFTAWDFSGREQLRPLWRYYFDDTAAVIFVVDSASTVLMQEAAEVLHGLLKVQELKDVPFLIYVNKQDIPTCMSVAEVTEALQLNNVVSHEVHVQGCCAQSGDGLYEGLDWLTKVIS